MPVRVAAMERASWEGIISGWKATSDIYSAGVIKAAKDATNLISRTKLAELQRT